jgi:hypothetical protein
VRSPRAWASLPLWSCQLQSTWPLSWPGSAQLAIHFPGISNFLGPWLQLQLHFHSFTHHHVRGLQGLYTLSATHCLASQVFLWNLGESLCDPISQFLCVWKTSITWIEPRSAVSRNCASASLNYCYNSLWVPQWLNTGKWILGNSSLDVLVWTECLGALFSKESLWNELAPLHLWACSFLRCPRGIFLTVQLQSTLLLL